MGTASQFEWVPSVYGTLYTIPAPQYLATVSLFACSSGCLANSDCGGFTWDKMEPQPCQFVVDPSIPGSNPSSKKEGYRLNDYRGKRLKILGSNLSTITWLGAHEDCLADGSKLLPGQDNYKERAQVTLRPSKWFFIDLKRLGDSIDSPYADKDGVVKDTSLLTFEETNPHLGDQLCLGGGYDLLLYFDWPCATMDSPHDLICIG